MNFRRVVTVLAVLALFAGLASAQNQVLGSNSCTVGGSNLTIRGEGVAERPGDVTLTCGNFTTNNATANGTVSQRVNITVDYKVPITSRIGNALVVGGVNYGYPSEILLTINDPGSGGGPVANYGQGTNAFPGPLVLCTAANSLADYINEITTGTVVPAPAGMNCPVFAFNTGGYVELDTTGAGGGQATSAIQGLVNGNTVTFYNVPIIGSGSGTVSELYRVTNVRLTPGTASTIVASVTTAVPITNATTNYATGVRWTLNTTATPTVAAVQATSMTTSVTPVGGISVCAPAALNPQAGQQKANVSLISFTEGFNTAFKTRTLPLTVGALGANDAATGAGNGVIPQSRPNGVWNYGPATAPALLAPGSATSVAYTLTAPMSESGFVTGAVTFGGVNAGLADSGTRLKAVFSGLDKNATYYVSRFNIVDYNTNVTFPANGYGDQTFAPNGVALPQTGAAPFNMETQAYAVAVQDAVTVNGISLQKLVVSATGTAEAVWEVTNATPTAADTIQFGVFLTFTSPQPTPANTALVQLGYAATAGANVAAVPTFNPPAAGKAFSNILKCQTTLLFPYVTNVTGYETGMAISNTSADPFGTAAASGSCDVYFYGANGTSGSIPFKDGSNNSTIGAGQMIANTATGLGLTNFNGYSIAVCGFQFAHGFAFVQNRAQTLGMGYLPLVIDTSLSSGAIRGQTFVGESLRN